MSRCRACPCRHCTARGPQVLNETVTLTVMGSIPAIGNTRRRHSCGARSPASGCASPRATDEPVRVLPDACSDLIWGEAAGACVAGPDTGAWLSTPVPGSGARRRALPPGCGRRRARPSRSATCATLRVALDELHARTLDARLRAELDPHEALRRVADDRALACARPADPTRRCSRPRAAGRPLRTGGRDARRRARPERAPAAPALPRGRRLRPEDAPARAALPPLPRRAQTRDLARAALDAGYADQAHLTRECVRLAGRTPAALLRG